MINQILITVLLVIPLIIMVIPSVKYWSDFKKEKRKSRKRRKAVYNKGFFYIFIIGVLCMWISWIGGIIFLFSNRFYNIFRFVLFQTDYAIPIQIVGLFIFYTGAIIYNLNIIIASKYIQPAPSGMLDEHKLIKKGPFAIIRHPLYVSYLLILTGLSLALLIYWLLIPVLFITIGIYSVASSEEKILIEQFGNEYLEYKKEVGMFFPRKKSILKVLGKRNK